MAERRPYEPEPGSWKRLKTADVTGGEFVDVPGIDYNQDYYMRMQFYADNNLTIYPLNSPIDNFFVNPSYEIYAELNIILGSEDTPEHVRDEINFILGHIEGIVDTDEWFQQFIDEHPPEEELFDMPEIPIIPEPEVADLPVQEVLTNNQRVLNSMDVGSYDPLSGLLNAVILYENLVQEFGHEDINLDQFPSNQVLRRFEFDFGYRPVDIGDMFTFRRYNLPAEAIGFYPGRRPNFREYLARRDYDEANAERVLFQQNLIQMGLDPEEALPLEPFVGNVAERPEDLFDFEANRLRNRVIQQYYEDLQAPHAGGGLDPGGGEHENEFGIFDPNMNIDAFFVPPGGGGGNHNLMFGRMPRTYKRKRGYRKKRTYRRKSAFYYDRVSGRREPKPWVARRVLGLGEPTNAAEWSTTHFGAHTSSATPQQRANRMASGYRGRGMYHPFRDVGQAAGRAVGGMFGNRHIGGAIGRSLGGLGGRFLGSGLYHGQGLYEGDVVNANALIAGSASVPRTHESVPGEDGSIIITHREYLTDVFGPGVFGGPAIAFENNSIRLNPGLQSSFPWLSQVAENYDEYEFLQLVFEFKSTTTDIGNSTNGQCGTIVMATNVNAAAQPFTDKQSMVTYQNAESCKVTEHMSHGVECEEGKTALSTRLYVRTNPVVGGQDLKTYDKGVFQYALCNLPSSYNGFPIGELWCYYKVRLNKTKLFTTRGLGIDRDVFASPTSTARGLTGTQAIPFPLSQIYYYGQQNNIGIACNRVSNTQLNLIFPANYVGNISVRVIQTAIGTCVVGTAAPNVSVVTGSFAIIRDLYDGDGNPANYCQSSSIPSGQVNGDVTTEVHFFVSSSTSGVDNVLSVTQGLGGGLLPLQTFIEVSQYNGLGMQSSEDLMVFVNPALPSQAISGNAI